MARKRYIFSNRLQLASFLKAHRRWLLLISCAILGLILPLILPSLLHFQPIKAQDVSAIQLAKQGEQQYNAGEFALAAQTWQQSANAFAQIGEQPGYIKSLINKSQAEQELGLSTKSCNTLLEVFELVSSNCSPTVIDELLATYSPEKNNISELQALALRRLGDSLRRIGQLAQSKAALTKSLQTGKNEQEEKATLLSLGNTERALANRIRDRKDYDELTEIIIDINSPEAAIQEYQQAFTFYQDAESAVSDVIRVQSWLNQFNLYLNLNQWWSEQTLRNIASWSRQGDTSLVKRAEDFLTKLNSLLTEKADEILIKILADLPKLNPNREAIYARINLAETLLQNQQTENVEALLMTALEDARAIQDRRGETYALGYLGRLYSQQGDLSKGIEITKQALILAQEQSINGDAREMTYLWQSQLGNLLKIQGNEKAAIAAYVAAYNTLQSLRSDLVVNNRDVQFDFRDEVKPVYIELADLLLRNQLTDEEINSLVVVKPKLTQTPVQDTKPLSRLELARQVIESLQLAELDNFFQDPCSEVTDVSVSIDDLDPSAVVIYPIVLPERLELIISLPGKILKQETINVSAKEVNATLDQLYDALDNRVADGSARNILDTTNPASEELKSNLEELLKIFAQLNNWLVVPVEQNIDSSTQTLVFIFNDRLQRVPIAALYDGQKYLIEKYNLTVVPSLQLVRKGNTQGQQWRVLAAGVSTGTRLGSLALPPLVNVEKELAQIKEVFPDTESLFNETFTAENIEQELRRRSFTVVHLATHGFFSSNPENNFILTGNNSTISITELSELLTTADFGAPDLLVLSACDTATGDERAVLGLAGVAVRSGASSTLASLWPVGDVSTAELMGNFYRELAQPGVKKVEALRKSQLALIESLKLNPPFEELKNLPPHPYSWAPYVVVGDWQ